MAITERLELSLDDALASISQLDAALNSAVTVTPVLDATAVITDLEAALANIAPVVTVTAEPDLAALEQALADITPPALTVTVDVNTETVQQALDAIQVPTLTVAVEADFTTLADQLVSVTAATIPPAVVPVEGDLSGLTAQLDALAIPTVTVPIDGDVSGLAAQIDAALAGINAQVPVSLDLTTALDDAATIESSLVDGAHTFADVLLKALDAAANATVVLTNVDVSALDTALATSLAAGGDTPVIPTVDTAGVTTAIDDAIAAADASAVVTPTADTSALTGEVDGALSGLSGVVPVNADTSALEGEVTGALSGVTEKVVVEADTSGIEPAVNDAVSGITVDPVTIDATVDTGSSAGSVDELTKSLSGLGGQAGAAGGGLTALETGAQGLAATTELAQGSASGLGGALGSIGPAAAAGVGGIVALAGATTVLFQAGLTATAAQERLNQVFGKTAEAVQHINIGGIVGQAKELATSIGSSGPALQQSIASLGEFGQVSGASTGLVNQTTQAITALGLRAAATRPQLGDAAAVTDDLARAFQRGGRSLVPFGISLTGAQISAKAMQIALADGRNEVTAFDKAAAGAQLSVAQLGTRLGSDFQSGSQQAAIQLKALKAQIEETLATAGKPLVVPLIDTLKALTPIATTLATSLGDVLAALLPIVTELVADFTPALVAGADAIGLLAVPIGLLADVLGAIPGPIKEVVAGLFLLKLAAGSGIADALIGSLFKLVPTIAAVGNAIQTAFQAGGIAAGLGTLESASLAAGVAVGLLAVPVLGTMAALGFFDEVTDKAGLTALKFGARLHDAAANTGDLFPVVNALFLKLNEGKGVIDSFGESAKALGLSQSSVVDAVASGGAKLSSLKSKLSEAEATLRNYGNASKVVLNGQEVDADKARAAVAKLSHEVDVGSDAVKRATAAVDAQIAKTIKQAEAEGTLTKAQVDRIRTQDTGRGGLDRIKFSTDITTAIARENAATQIATQVATQNAAALIVQKSALGGSSAAWLALAGSIASGTTGLADAATVTAQFGINAKDFATIVQNVNTAVDKFVNDAVSKLPQAGDAFKAVADVANSVDLAGAIKSATSKTGTFDLGISTKDLFLQQVGIQDFFANVNKIAANGGTQLAAQLLTIGATAGGGFAKAVAAQSPAATLALQNLITPKFDLASFKTQLDEQARAVSEFTTRIVALLSHPETVNVGTFAARQGFSSLPFLRAFQDGAPALQKGIEDSLTGTTTTAVQNAFNVLNSPAIRGALGPAIGGILDSAKALLPGFKLAEPIAAEVGKIPGVITAATPAVVTATAAFSSSVGVAAAGSFRSVPPEIGRQLIAAGVAIEVAGPVLTGKAGALSAGMEIQFTHNFNPSVPISAALAKADAALNGSPLLKSADAIGKSLDQKLHPSPSSVVFGGAAAQTNPGAALASPETLGAADTSGTTVAARFATSAATRLQTFGTEATPAVTSGFAAVSQVAGQAAVTAGTGAGASFGVGLADGITAATAAAAGAAVGTALDGGATIGRQFDAGARDALVGRAGEVEGAATAMAGTLANAAAPIALEQGAQVGRRFDEGARDAIIGRQGEISAAAAQATSNLGAAQGAAYEGGAEIGRSFDRGIRDAILGRIGEVAAAAAAVAHAAVASGGAAIKKGSPSKLTYDEIGVPFAQGIALGITATGPQVNAAAAGLFDTLPVPPAIPITATVNIDTKQVDATLAALPAQIPPVSLDAALAFNQGQVDAAFANITAGLAVAAPNVDIAAAVHVDTTQLDAVLAELATPRTVDVDIAAIAPVTATPVQVVAPPAAAATTAPAQRQMTDAELLAAIRAAVRAEGGIHLDGPLIENVNTTQAMDAEAVARKTAFLIGV